ncbi:putative mediator complex subunit 18 [Heterostelium album PN500]|uniref:Mediator of RNA polymerase II transcription subunit 18 n=1 Tax=Heterostelium pallidum (strain ATCC 26659 / Pp 5 / PN500) TaxID=670386 RepID=D3B8C3_HETP5|nr:putative mediator complex subunit 18 [Heterostelium album PN500]EFA82291.1 putative mediator complex subunit 18 [Heterostelium album PN500]|eukprot:XP_020434408.1 putative mediator complex subunit 18 [Heterostelium album PN500]
MFHQPQQQSHHHHHHTQQQQHHHHQHGNQTSPLMGGGGSGNQSNPLSALQPQDNRVKGMMRADHKFSYKETVYRSTVVSSGPMWAENSILPSEIHIRTEKPKSTRSPNQMQSTTNAKDKMSARYVGVPQIKDKINAVIRNVVDISVSDKFIQLIENMGYVKDYEYYVDGFCYSTYYVSLYIVQHSRSLPDGSQGESLTKNSMVELQCLSGEEGFSQAADYLNTYAEYLYPFVLIIQ